MLYAFHLPFSGTCCGAPPPPLRADPPLPPNVRTGHRCQCVLAMLLATPFHAHPAPATSVATLIFRVGVSAPVTTRAGGEGCVTANGAGAARP